MDEFDKLLAQRIPTRDAILEQVDEYSLYRYYTEIDDLIPGKPVSSPIRDGDDTPSFCIFPTHGGNGYYGGFEFTWKDHAIYQTGNIFTLIKLLYGYQSFLEVYALICNDFALDFDCQVQKKEKVRLYECPDPVDTYIRVHSIPFTLKGIDYWKQFNIGMDLVNLYNVKQIDYYWSYIGQETPIGCVDPTFAYEIGGFYQVYSPTNPKRFKFRNNLPPEYFLGYLQLPKEGDTVVIDKSMKDLIFCKRLGISAVAGKSETTLIPPAKVLDLKTRFRRVFLMLDNDEAGRRQTEKYLNLYPWMIPKFLEEAKDKTDLCLKVGFEKASEIIKKLIL